MALFFFLLSGLIHAIQPFLTPLCFLLAWGIILMGGWSILAALRDGVKQVRQLHQIPCANCQFFTNSSYLKCPVHPSMALSEEAIGCRDYEAGDRAGSH
ncbi:MAG: hypothetical protein HC781_03175 [Leptolyngbyaceae cyanobacterium CSU_1_4]|nr:hypothetical protein [Leptolyngbyaceae cyanobacterium CSU_1_4]